MLIIWRGWGALAPVIAIVGWLVPLALLEGVLGHATYIRFSGAFSLIFGFAAAAAIWFVGQALNSVPGRVLVDPSTGQRVVLRKRHDLFFIPMQWWAIPVALFVALALFGA